MGKDVAVLLWNDKSLVTRYNVKVRVALKTDGGFEKHIDVIAKLKPGANQLVRLHEVPDGIAVGFSIVWQEKVEGRDYGRAIWSMYSDHIVDWNAVVLRFRPYYASGLKGTFEETYGSVAKYDEPKIQEILTQGWPKEVSLDAHS